MRIESDLLVFKALCALDQAANECEAGPLRRTFALRFALAYLFAVSKGDRQAFDDFWRIIADPIEWGYSESQARYFRGSHARTALKGIALSVGYPQTPEAIQRLSVWRKGAKPVPPDNSLEN
jgi:hypothetical protein